MAADWFRLARQAYNDQFSVSKGYSVQTVIGKYYLWTDKVVTTGISSP